MSDINLDFTVSNNSIDFTVQPNDITITPTDVQLTLNANFQPLAGGNATQLQYNNGGILAGVANTSYTSGNLTLGDVANIKITGGTNGYVLQTDGAGNLDWTAMTGGGGNGTPGGSNTQIQYNDNGTFGGNTGFTFNEITGNVAIPGSLAVVGNITGNVQTAYLANYATFANGVDGANVSGAVPYATVANLVAVGNVSGLGNIATINLDGNVSNALLGNGSWGIPLSAPGGSNTQIQYNNNGSIAGISNVTWNGNNFRIDTNEIQLGYQAGQTSQGSAAVAIGYTAGQNTQSTGAVAIGRATGAIQQGNYAIAVGQSAGLYKQGRDSIAIGQQAGGGDSNLLVSQGNFAIGIGTDAGRFAQNTYAIALGAFSAQYNQGANAIAIGTYAGKAGMGNNAIAIGRNSSNAGASQPSNSIILNATGSNTNATQANSLFIKPIRDVTGNVDFTVTLKYNPTTGEIGYV